MSDIILHKKNLYTIELPFVTHKDCSLFINYLIDNFNAKITNDFDVGMYRKCDLLINQYEIFVINDDFVELTINSNNEQSNLIIQDIHSDLLQRFSNQ